MFTEKIFSIPSLTGLSKAAIDEHMKLYSGYVKHANLVQEKLRAYKADDTKAYEIAELYRRFSFEYNGMRNHEVYFALLSGADDDAPHLMRAIEKQWSSLEAWKRAFSTLGLTRGIGWAMMSYDGSIDALVLHWVDEQHLGQLQGTVPIVALDLWEHAYVADYQPSGKKKYIEDVIAQIRWSAAEANFVAAQGAR